MKYCSMLPDPLLECIMTFSVIWSLTLVQHNLSEARNAGGHIRYPSSTLDDTGFGLGVPEANLPHMVRIIQSLLSHPKALKDLKGSALQTIRLTSKDLGVSLLNETDLQSSVIAEPSGGHEPAIPLAEDQKQIFFSATENVLNVPGRPGSHDENIDIRRLLSCCGSHCGVCKRTLRFMNKKRKCPNTGRWLDSKEKERYVKGVKSCEMWMTRRQAFTGYKNEGFGSL